MRANVFESDLRPSFDVIVLTLKNIWKNWKNSLETYGDISQVSKIALSEQYESTPNKRLPPPGQP